ncbi:MAG TPA: 16S rRNA (adenine(1518)-N(6)/adenine(1519)-N(6))-dimethyltransferase RsmA [Bacteroidia bacterium]|nr:16S rRNA (adenine(1518)-N(6)/adenine(1519)-N(6))-dimethyltransferase RsmA [Bacteroidia bacterium]HNU33840.1 16S rRNA (adenine(1518)-N(6)/adenine(1519)-N(6))-dimethyltransferase RsmA [Bacteroidia bacterium]
MNVKPKKHLGQHFLTDLNTAKKIADALLLRTNNILEIGPGTGVLTQFLIDKNCNLKLIEIDGESVNYLKKNFAGFKGKIIEGDFLELDIKTIFNEPLSIIGNFPYNISTEILFKVLENKDFVTEVVGMFQKEVAERVASAPGNKNYGIPSVLLQAFFDIEYLFTVNENVFNPPPKVKSGVIRLIRTHHKKLKSEEQKFKLIVKSGFNKRRKTLNNSLKPLLPADKSNIPYLNKRPEQLSWEQFDELTIAIFSLKNQEKA